VIGPPVYSCTLQAVGDETATGQRERGAISVQCAARARRCIRHPEWQPEAPCCHALILATWTIR